MARMEGHQQINPITNNTSFCFKYCINLGDGKFGTMKIHEKTDLYEQAENFCKIHGLQPYIAVILENQIFQQILKIKQEKMSKEQKSTKHISNIQKNKKSKSQQKLSAMQKDTNKNTMQKSKLNDISHQSFMNTSSMITNQNDKNQKKQNITKHFQNMFKKHEEIQNRKQMERKASFSKISFKPVINNLSRKIVDLKRSALTKNDQNQNHSYKNNTKSNITLNTQKSKEKQNKQNDGEIKKSFKVVRKASKAKFL